MGCCLEQVLKQTLATTHVMWFVVLSCYDAQLFPGQVFDIEHGISLFQTGNLLRTFERHFLNHCVVVVVVDSLLNLSHYS